MTEIRSFVAALATGGAVLMSAAAAEAELRLPALFGDHMVLQQESHAPIWGWAEPGERVEIVADWLKAPIAATADDHGAFRAEIPTLTASQTPRQISIRAGADEIVLTDVLIGEVWLCSGQSNMEWPLHAAMNGEEEVKGAEDAFIRLFQVENAVSAAPREDCGGAWEVCSPPTAADFSAVGYFFGRDLRVALDVPVGLIDATWGGTPAEAWTSADSLRPLGDFDETLDRLASGSIGQVGPNHPTSLYNAMIAPLQPFALRGAVWYQGEANVGRGEQYQRLFPAMIADWRHGWGRGNFPFYFVQIAPWRYPNDNGGAARLREAQVLTLDASPHTGMVVTTDIGNVDDIHPRNKQEVGRRLSLWALAGAYGRHHLECSGPLFERMTVAGSTARIEFTHAGSGLACNGEALTDFKVAGADRVFHDAQAIIDGETIVVSCPEVAGPVAVRFGFDAIAEPNLFNGDGLPASPFRTDDWEDVP